MDWNSLISTQNLKLAWRRINTGRNLQYKRFFREAYLVYESASDEHIRELHKQLTAKDWNPHHAKRLYLPKPSGLQRPLSLLDIDDQIMLQAIANKFATKLHKKRQRVELKTVFSNKLASSQNSIFFMEHWQKTYSAFQDKCTEVFQEGLRWSVHFDLSAYYDTISHDLLLSPVLSREQDLYTTVKEWLLVWSADSHVAMTGHGIPQGPIASHFLAEAFFLPIDIQLQKQKNTFHYLRYVDDIRLFARSENEVRKAAILLEQQCRDRGLIPQSTKFAIRELKSANEAMGSLPSIPPTDGKDASKKSMGVSEARKILTKAIDGRPQRVTDKSRFRYVMYRAPADNEILNTVLRLLPRHPEHIDAFVAYFSNYGKRSRISRRVLDYLKSGIPYTYVRGELWHIVARTASEKEMKRGLPMAREDAKSRGRCVALSWGVMHFLMKCEEKGLARNWQRLKGEHPISRSLLAPIFPDQAFKPGGHVTILLKGNQMEQLAGARELQRRNISLAVLDLSQKILKPSCKTALASLGVIKRKHGSDTRDRIAEILKKLYRCNGVKVWRKLLGAEYEYALQILIETKVYYPGHRSEWLGLQDSFFDTIIRQFFAFLKQRELEGHLMTSSKNGNLIPYGKLIEENNKFEINYPDVANPLRAIHNRRNRLPGTHPYDMKGGTRNRWLTQKEMDKLVLEVKKSINAITKIVEDNR